MPGPPAEQNLQIPHPRDWQGGQMPRSSPGGGKPNWNWLVHNKHTCPWSSCLASHLQGFFKDQRKKDGGDFEPDTMSSFQKTSASHWRAKTYSALSFDRWNLFEMAHLHLDFTFKCYCFLEPIKTFTFWRLSNDYQIAWPALVSGPLNRKPFHKHLVSLVFSVRSV